jgi:hypothetical protein
MSRERRRRPRVDWDGEAVAQVGMHRIRCRGRDLSATGLALEGEWVAYPGQHVSVQLSVEGQRIDAYGEVAWAAAAEGRYVWGIRFVALHERCRRSLEAYVERRIEEIESRTPVPGVPQSASQIVTDAVVFGRAREEDEVTLDGPFDRALLAAAVDTSALDLDDLPTGVFRRVPPEIHAVPVPVITGNTVRVSLHDAPSDGVPEPIPDFAAPAPAPERIVERWSSPAVFACPVPPLLDDSPLDRSRELVLDLGLDPAAVPPPAFEPPTVQVEAPTSHVEAPTCVHVEMPTTVNLESPTGVRVDPRELKRRRIEEILSASKRRTAEPEHPAPVPTKSPAATAPVRARSDRFDRVDGTPQMRALYEAALRDLER